MSVSVTCCDDVDLFALMRRELYSAVIGDVMDKLGLFHQFLPPRIGPVRGDMILAGRAMPIVEVDVDPEAASDDDKPFGVMLEALDDLRPGEIYVAAGASPHYALWGELMATRAKHLGAAGALVDGYARDISGILVIDFPTFAIGAYAQDQGPRGKVVDFRVPVEIGGIRIESGTLLFGDSEGVVAVPAAAEAEVIARAIEKARGERLVKKAIEDGMGAVEAFAKFGIM